MVKHTEGPWRECGSGGCVCGLVWSTKHDVVVATATGRCEEQGIEIPVEIQQANARLIAAAPDLLDALKAVLDFKAGHIPLDALVEIAARNIAKAEGES